jgi:hypothetical protein
MGYFPIWNSIKDKKRETCFSEYGARKEMKYSGTSVDRMTLFSLKRPTSSFSGRNNTIKALK